MTKCSKCGQELPAPTRLRGFELCKGADIKTILPRRKTKHSAGYDFFLPHDVHIDPFCESEPILFGVKAYMQDNEHLQLHIRSSYGFKKKLRLVNIVGIIDADYYGNPENDGNIAIVLCNRSGKPVDLKKGDSAVQGIFIPYLLADRDDATDERIGGVGSTGR